MREESEGRERGKGVRGRERYLLRLEESHESFKLNKVQQGVNPCGALKIELIHFACIRRVCARVLEIIYKLRER